MTLESIPDPHVGKTYHRWTIIEVYPGSKRNGGTSEYRSWHHMKERCYNPKNKNYNLYGGRGIKVCDRWKDSFENFLGDMGLKPSKEYSIDRIDNNGNYEPENCRWVDQRTQVNNSSRYDVKILTKCPICKTDMISDNKRIKKYCSYSCSAKGTKTLEETNRKRHADRLLKVAVLSTPR